MDLGFFETVRDAFEGFVSGVDGQRNTYVHSRGLKAWFDDDTREHYEAQLVRVDGALQLEVGFHAEHPKAALNDAVLQRIRSTESAWRTTLGEAAVAGDFIARAGWRRISELWPANETPDIDEAIEVAARFADYVIALEPARRSSHS